ncbi:MAG: hypothetical protein FD138_987 [Planctomycetota bacterium]|nr:MAG: hypothetical protein FD138_987 [Planctomycetota bacterium]
MHRNQEGNWTRVRARWLFAVTGGLLILRLIQGPIESADKDDVTDPALQPWLKPQEWRRDSETPALALGEKGRFDDQHIFAPHVIQMDGEFWMYYSGSQRCVDAGTYKGVAKDPKQPEKSDQRLFKLGSGIRRSRSSVSGTTFIPS